MMLVSPDKAQILQAWLSKKQAGDLLDLHHRACPIRKNLDIAPSDKEQEPKPKRN
jgi:hypothetical protein